MRCVRSIRNGGAAIAVGLSLFPHPGRADESAFCRKVRAQADGDRALMMAPRVVVQGIRFPAGNQLGIGATAGTGYQVRTGIVFSFLDFYKGTKLGQLADAQCSVHEASAGIERVLETAADAARLEALRAQEAYLNENRSRWRAMTARAQERLAARVATVVEFDQLRSRADALERKRVEVMGETKRLEARDFDAPREPLQKLVERHNRETMKVERQAWNLHSLDGWQFQLTAGVIPIEPVDWYGVAEVSYSLGLVARDRTQARYLDARHDELHAAPEEMPFKLRKLADDVAAALDQARRELEIVEGQVSAMADAQGALERSETSDSAQAHDTVAMEIIAAEADRVFLRTSVDALSRLSENLRQR